MKKLLCITIALVAANSFADQMFMPRTSTTTLNDSPLANGEVAFEKNDDGTASVWVGSDGKNLPVYPQMTLKGNGVRVLGSDEYFVSVPQGYVFNSGDKLWHDTNATCTTNQLIVTLKDGVTVKNVDYTLINWYTDLVPISNAKVTHIIQGNIIIFTLARYDIRGDLAIGEFEISIALEGSSEGENDLTKIDYILRDEIGSVRMSNLRTWARDLYNGNRGEDWSKYVARNSVRLNGNRISFDSNDSFDMALGEETNLLIRAYSHDIIEVYSTNVTDAVGTIGITGLIASNGTVKISYTNTIENFDTTKIRVKAWPELNGLPEWVPGSQMTVTANNITMISQPTGKCFYRIYYGTVVIDDIIVDFNSPVRFNNDVILKGDDGVNYRLSINNGVISAIAQ